MVVFCIQIVVVVTCISMCVKICKNTHKRIQFYCMLTLKNNFLKRMKAQPIWRLTLRSRGRNEFHYIQNGPRPAPSSFQLKGSLSQGLHTHERITKCRNQKNSFFPFVFFQSQFYHLPVSITIFLRREYSPCFPSILQSKPHAAAHPALISARFLGATEHQITSS